MRPKAISPQLFLQIVAVQEIGIQNRLDGGFYLNIQFCVALISKPATLSSPLLGFINPSMKPMSTFHFRFVQ